MMRDATKVRVTVTTDVLDVEGHTIASVRLTHDESIPVAGSGSDTYIPRVAHRVTERAADDTRVMLGQRFGEVEEKWREAATR